MDIQHAINTFRRYSSQEKTDFLLRLAHEMTILARDTYEVGDVGLTNPSRLRRINEVQHRVLSSVIALRNDDPKRYPDDVLVKLILVHADDIGLQRQLQEVFSHLMAERAARA
jgi:hypothetical protein